MTLSSSKPAPRARPLMLVRPDVAVGAAELAALPR